MTLYAHLEIVKKHANNTSSNSFDLDCSSLTSLMMSLIDEPTGKLGPIKHIYNEMRTGLTSHTYFCGLCSTRMSEKKICHKPIMSNKVMRNMSLFLTNE